MNSRLRLLLAAGAAALVALGILRWKSAVSPATAPKQAQLAPHTQPEGVVRLDATAQANAGIAIVSVTEIEHRDRILAPGVLALDETRTARIGATIEGKVLSVAAAVGDRVVTGQVLALLHSPLVHDIWAAYRKAVATRRQAESELNYAREAHARAERLYTAKAISLQELQRAQADRLAAEQTLDMARTEVRRQEEILEHLGITSRDDPSGESGEFIPVRAPLPGAVLERSVTPGGAVTPGAGLFVISDLSTLWALAEIDETKIPRTHIGQPVEVFVTAYPDRVFSGDIIFVADTLDPKTRRITVRCRVPNEEGLLKPQMFATIALGEEEPRKVAVVPHAAVQQIDGDSVVFLAQDDGTFQRRQVRTGGDIDGSVEILEGLKPGDRIVSTGSFLLKSELLRSAIEEQE